MGAKARIRQHHGIESADRFGAGCLHDHVELVVVVFRIGVIRIGGEAVAQIGDAFHFERAALHLHAGAGFVDGDRVSTSACCGELEEAFEFLGQEAAHAIG